MTADELAAFRADKARLSGDKPEYKALKKRFLNEALRRVAALGGPKRVAGLPAMGEAERVGSTFVSPSVAQHATWETSVAPPSLRDTHFSNASHDVDRRMGMRTVQSSAIGAWSDGAEPSVMTQTKGESWDRLKLAAAMKGHLGDQKAVLVFKEGEPGGSAIKASFPATGSLDDIHKNLLADVLAFHTLEPIEGGAIVHVADMDGSLHDAVVKGANRYGAEVDTRQGRVEFIPPDTKGETDREQRDNSRRVYAETIRSSPVPGAATIWDGLYNRWAEPLGIGKEAVRSEAPRGPFLGAGTRGYTGGEGGEGTEAAERGPRRESGFSIVRDVAQNLTANAILDPRTPAIKGPDIKGHNLNASIARYLEQRGSNALRALGVASGKIEGPDPRTDAILKNALVSEVKAALVRDKKVGTDWYTNKCRATIKVRTERQSG
jgi:hypothetical protein